MSLSQISRHLIQKGVARSTAATTAGLRSFSAAVEPPISDKSAAYIELEDKHGAHNYHPLPVVLSKGEGKW